jgi:hypothetical protein
LGNENQASLYRLRRPRPAVLGGKTALRHRLGPRNQTRRRLYSRNAYDWTARLSAIAAAAEQIKAKSFTIDGEAVVLGPDGLSRFEELQRRTAAHAAVLYAFDLIEHDGEDLRGLPFLDRKAALARLLRETANCINGLQLFSQMHGRADLFLFFLSTFLFSIFFTTPSGGAVADTNAFTGAAP